MQCLVHKVPDKAAVIYCHQEPFQISYIVLSASCPDEFLSSRMGISAQQHHLPSYIPAVMACCPLLADWLLHSPQAEENGNGLFLPNFFHHIAGMGYIREITSLFGQAATPRGGIGAPSSAAALLLLQSAAVLSPASLPRTHINWSHMDDSLVLHTTMLHTIH